MKTKDECSCDAEELRRRAEERIRALEALTMQSYHECTKPAETRRALYELRVHQIELEMQNEELRRAQVELDAVRARYFDLYDLAPVGYCTLSEKGLILETNLTAAKLLGVARGALLDRLPIFRFIVEEDQYLYYLRRKRLAETGDPQAFELRMLNNGGTPFWAHLDATAATDVGGEQVYRVMMSDISERKQTEQMLQEASDQIKTLRGIVPICAHCKNICDV